MYKNMFGYLHESQGVDRLAGTDKFTAKIYSNSDNLVMNEL